MSNILVCLIFQRALLGVLVDDLADGTFFAILEAIDNLSSALVEQLGLVVPTDHLHNLATDTGAYFGKPDLKPPHMTAGIAAVPFLKLEGYDT